MPRFAEPKVLAQEQWDACSHFPSVKLVEVTTSGQLVVRETAASEPPNAYLRCLSGVALKQVLAGRRHGSDIVRRAYFTDRVVRSGTISELAGPTPVSVKKFEPGRDVIFFYDLDGLDKEVAVNIVWRSPQGVVVLRRVRFIGPTAPNYRGTWSTDRMTLPVNRPGLWSVRLSIEHRPAGAYEFQVR